jgi:Xaa-Pro aminopeptidase
MGHRPWLKFQGWGTWLCVTVKAISIWANEVFSMRRLFVRFLSLLALLVALRCFALEKQPVAEYHARRVALSLKLKGPALIFGADEPNEEYLSWRQDEDFYYLTGWNEPGAALLIIPAQPALPANALAGTAASSEQSYREILYLPERFLRMELYKGAKLDAATPNAPALAGVDEVRQISQLVNDVVQLHYMSLTIPGDDAKAKTMLDALGAAFDRKPAPKPELRGLVAELRGVKSAGEIGLLRKAAFASIAAQAALFQRVKPGVSERTISGLIDYKLKENGCERPSYPSIVGSGPNSTILHYMADENTMQAGGLVVIDAAGEYSMYAMDITRTLPVSGHFTDRQREIYDIVLGAQRAAMAAFVSGKSYMGYRGSKDGDSLMGYRQNAKDTESLDKIAYDYINTHGKDLHGQPLGQYFIHGLGHSVGIDVHDPFDYTKTFGPGSVFTIEPGIYIPEEQIGVRIEDTFYVDADGKLVNFIANLPHTAEDVEAAMSAPAKSTGKRH